MNQERREIKMKCAYHNDKDAVATCNICGKTLCSACASVINPPQCIGCYREGLVSRMYAARRALITDILLGIAVAIFLPVLMSWLGDNNTYGLVVRLLFFGAPFGWRFFNKITPNIFLFMPIIGWVIYFCIKFGLSMTAGIFVAPYTIWKEIKEVKQVQKSIDAVANLDNRSLAVQ